MSQFRRRVAIALLGSSALGACASDQDVTAPSRTLTPTQSTSRHDVLPDADPGIWACKETGPAGTYQIHADIKGPGAQLWVYGPDATIEFDGVNEACVFVAKSDLTTLWPAGAMDTVTITETGRPAGAKADSAGLYSSMTGLEYARTPGNSYTFTVAQPDRVWFEFFGSAQPATTLPGSVDVCKTSGPAGNYTYLMSVTGGGDKTLPNGYVKTIRFNGTSPSCATMYMPKNIGSWPSGATATVTLTEILRPFNVDPRSLTVTLNGNVTNTVMNEYRTTVVVGATDVAQVKFAGIKWDLGNQGCSVNFWKSAAGQSKWAASGYSQTQKISSLLDVPTSLTLNNKQLGQYTLLEGLNFAGGSNTSGKAQLLIRSTIAAALNAAHPTVDFASPLVVIIPAADLALASNSSFAMSLLQMVTDATNAGRGGCPID
jgi:hypothetical protein